MAADLLLMQMIRGYPSADVLAVFSNMDIVLGEIDS
jgi:NADH:ubiquinone oxidoreductase subunit D